MKSLTIRNNDYQLPMFLPDSTRGVVRSLDSKDLNTAETKGVVVNTFHLMNDPGVEVLKSSGGIKNFMGFNGLIASDSGGWQVYSLIHRSKRRGKISNLGVEFYLNGTKRQIFTPEKSIKVQFEISSDIIICLDDFTPPESFGKAAKVTIERTVKWAKKAKKEYQAQLEKRKIPKKQKPLLMAVVQGGYDKNLRKECFERLQEIGFDAYGYGGYVVDNEGQLDLEISKYLVDLLPEKSLKFALGMGRPWDMAALSEMGWDMFDCTLPTRDARHRRLYTFKTEPRNLNDLKDKNNYTYLYINKIIYQKDKKPISDLCNCHTCQNYSRAYLRHLFKIGEISAYRLATIHNLHFYNNLLRLIRVFA